MSFSPYGSACTNRGDKVDLTSNWCKSHQRQFFKKLTSKPCPLVWTSKQGLENHSAIDISARKRLKPYFGAHGAGETPVLIPNTEVKLSSGDYTATSGKLARCRIIVKPSE